MNQLNNSFRISKNGIDLITKFEGCRLKPYNCPAGHATVGIGHLIHKGPVNSKDIELFKDLTKNGAEELLSRDMINYETPVKTLVTYTINQNQFDALVSFVYNLGSGTFQKSTMLKLINAGNLILAADEFLKYTKATVLGVKKELPGLVNRRTAERSLFLKR